MRVVIVGAGAMGLAAGYYAEKAGHEVELFEAGAKAGGIAAHFDFGGLSIERFYHFICTSDKPTFKLLAELGIADRLRWRRTSMGYFIDGKLHEWGAPPALLKSPRLSDIAKIRYGLHALISTRRSDWDALEDESAKCWFVRWAGKEAFDRLREPLLRLKFYNLADNISRRWIRTQIRRIGRSRRWIFEQKLGYPAGGSETLVARLVELIKQLGGAVHTSTSIVRVDAAEGRVTGISSSLGLHRADAVIMTVPTLLVPRIGPALPAEWRAMYAATINIEDVCLLSRLRRSATRHFWGNVSMPDVAIPGVIEFSNFRPLPYTIVFVPYYMPSDQEQWGSASEELADQAFAYLKRINPALTDVDLIDRHAAKLLHAGPACVPAFVRKIPPVETPIKGLRIADTCFYYPEDRGISESVRFGREMAARLGVAA